MSPDRLVRVALGLMQQFVGVDADGARDRDVFAGVKSPLPCLVFRDKGLGQTEFRGQIGGAHPLGLARSNEKLKSPAVKVVVRH